MTLTVFLYIVFTGLVKELSAQVVKKSFQRVNSPTVYAAPTGLTFTSKSLLACATKISLEHPDPRYFFYNSSTKSCSGGASSSVVLSSSFFSHIYRFPIDQVLLQYFNVSDPFFVYTGSPLNFTEAEDRCLGIGSHLARADSLKKFMNVTSTILLYWVGGSDFDGDNEFQWINDGSNIPNQTLTELLFNNNSTNIFTAEFFGNCLVYCANHKQLHIYPCQTVRGFLCDMS